MLIRQDKGQPIALQFIETFVSARFFLRHFLKFDPFWVLFRKYDILEGLDAMLGRYIKPIKFEVELNICPQIFCEVLSFIHGRHDMP